MPSAKINTARFRIRTIDSKGGQYPSIIRTGDKDRKGNNAVFFDDRNTVIFSSGSTSTLSYPTLLQPGSVHLRNAYTSSLTAPGTSRKGVSDILVDIPAQEESISPFVEDGLFEQTSASADDPFYLTGSRVQDVGIGLQYPLKSKTKITIDLNPITSSQFGYDAEATVTSSLPFFPMVYYNFSSKKWDKIGTGSFNPSPVDNVFKDRVSTFLSQAPIGFSRGAAMTVTASHLQCLPISNFGFPIHPKFHATSSQLFSLSNVISQPFLVEKFVYEF